MAANDSPQIASFQVFGRMRLLHRKVMFMQTDPGVIQNGGHFSKAKESLGLYVGEKCVDRDVHE